MDVHVAEPATDMLLSSSTSILTGSMIARAHVFFFFCRTGMDEKTFATIMILLPSEFTGGSMHISFDGKSEVFDTSRVSLLETTVLAWHTGVSHEMVGLRFSYVTPH
jgi:hypothetical protein